jgi:hypothetical protein
MGARLAHKLSTIIMYQTAIMMQTGANEIKIRNTITTYDLRKSGKIEC